MIQLDLLDIFVFPNYLFFIADSALALGLAVTRILYGPLSNSQRYITTFFTALAPEIAISNYSLGVGLEVDLMYS